MNKLTKTALVGSALLGVGFASASNLATAGGGSWFQGRVQQSAKVTATCDSDGVEFSYDVTPGVNRTQAVTLRGIDAKCANAGIAVETFLADGTSQVSNVLAHYNSDVNVAPYGAPTLTFPNNMRLRDIVEPQLTIADAL